MAIAKAEITISRIIDIAGTTRYYLLQSSTASAPSVPTKNPPGGNWITTEPTYTTGSTNTLYFVDLTEFTNDTYKYSEVSKSSSYEAAKAAYNKAVAAQNTANSAQQDVDDLEEDVLSIQTRVLNAETQIEKNNEAISLSATKTEVTEAKNAAIADTDNKLKNYSTTAQMNSALAVKANEITSHVSATYTTKEDLENLEVGGRNFVLSSDTSNTISPATGVLYKLWNLSDYGKKSLPIDQQVTISFDAYADNNTAVDTYIRGSNGEVSNISSACTVTTSVTRFHRTVTMASEGPLTVSVRSSSAVAGYTGAAVHVSNIKVELGNKATDWTPAPEDVDTRIGAAESKISQQADSITAVVAKANQNATDIATLKLTSDAFEVRFGTVETDIDTAISNAAKAQEDIDNLNVGGRNLLLDSRVIYSYSNNSNTYPISCTVLTEGSRTFTRTRRTSTSSYPTTFSIYNTINSSQLSMSLKPGEEITFSCLVRGSLATTCQLMHYMQVNGETRNFPSHITVRNITTEWQRISATVTILNYTEGSTVLFRFTPYQIAIPNGEIDNFYLDMCEWKIEKGNRVTDWTPAPEDVDSAVDSAQSTADTALGNANLAQSTADGIKTDLANNYTKKTLPDTRNDNQNPGWYVTNYPRQIITEFKLTSAIGLSGAYYSTLTTTVPWANTSGGLPTQVAKVGDKEYWRVGTSETAWGPWNNPAATATNYMKFENNTGLIIGDMTASTLGRNVLIDSDSIDIRNGASVMASYRDTAIYLGMNSPTSVIDLCSGTGQITSSALSENDDWWQLTISSQNSIGLESGGNIIMNTDYSNGASESHTTFSMGSNLPFGDDVLCYGIWSVSGTSGSNQYLSSIDLYWSYASIAHSGPYGISQIRLDEDGIIFDAIATTSGAVQVSGRLDVTGAMKFTTNNSRIWGTETDGTEVEVFQAKNSSNNTVIGWGNYNGNAGNTNVYGNNVLVRSKKDVTIYADGGNAILRSDNESPDGYSKVYGPEVYIHPVNTHTSFRPYYHGVDSFTTIFRGAGYVTSSGKSVYFAIPLAKPIIGNTTVTVVSTNGFVLRQNNSYTHGSAYASSGYTYAKPASYSASVDGSGSYILVNATFSVNTNATNNSPIGIDWTGKVTFAYG